MEEKILTGGNVNNSVVKVGDTVRRHQSSQSEAVQALLHHLKLHCYPFSPRFLGVDSQGREILSYLEGSCDVASLFWVNNDALITAAGMLSNFHDLSAQLDPRDFKWAQSYPDKARHEVVCHNDFAPYNLIVNDGCPTGVIDFDLAGPGPRIRDVAYAVYWMAPLSLRDSEMSGYAEADLLSGSRRAKAFCLAYGVRFDADLLDMVGEILQSMCDRAWLVKVIGLAATDKLQSEGHLRHWSEESSVFQKNLPRFLLNV